jgi:hypothetical protein
MKCNFFVVLLSTVVLIGCSRVQHTKRVPSSILDVGVIGPRGEVILYYKEGDKIIVKSCDPNTVLGLTPALARSNCQGKTNKVPVESFKQALRNLVSTERLNVLKPLTPEEVQEYAEDGSSSDQIEAILIELDKINAFITSYGAENADLVRKEELVMALRSSEARMSAIHRINSEIEKALNLITDQTKLALTKFNSDKDQFLYTVLKNFDPFQKFPCGLKGSVDERVKNCSYQLNSEKEGFILVTRTKDFKEVHKEIKTGLLWGDRLPLSMTHYNAEKACKADLGEVGGISEMTWRLPSKEEYEEAEKNGIRKALPNMNYWFWSSSVRRNDSDVAWQFLGDFGYTYNLYRSSEDSVRCVAR